MKQKNKKGFSLIELMIVIAIISIMAGIILSSTSQGRTKHELETAMREVAAGIRGAQNNALSGKRSGSNRPCHFAFKAGANLYEIEGEFYDPTKTSNCDSTTIPLVYATVGAGNLPTGVAVTSTYKGNSISEIKFMVPFGEIFANNGATAMGTVIEEAIEESIRVTVQKEGLSYVICVAPSGRIDELGITSDACVN